MVLLFTALIGFRPALGAELLTADAAVREALAGNLDLAAARARLPIARAARLRANQALPANPELEAGYSTGALTGSPGELDWEVGLSQEFEIGGQRGLRLAIADLGIHRAELEFADAERRVTAEVKRAFYRLLFAQERRAVVEALVGVSDQLRVAAAARYRTQDISLVDRDLAALEYERALAQRTTAESDVAAGRIALVLLLGRPQAPDLTVGGQIVPPAHAPLLEELIRVALQTRPDLRILAVEAEAAQREAELAGREAIPNLKVGLGYTRAVGVINGDDIQGDPAIARGITRIEDADSLLRVRLSLPIPVFNAGQPEAARARAAQAQALAARDALARTIRADVGVAFERGQRLGDALARYQRIIPGYEKSISLMVAGYRAGELGLEAVLASRERLFRTRLAYLELAEQYQDALAALAAAVGRVSGPQGTP